MGTEHIYDLTPKETVTAMMTGRYEKGQQKLGSGDIQAKNHVLSQRMLGAWYQYVVIYTIDRSGNKLPFSSSDLTNLYSWMPFLGPHIRALSPCHLQLPIGKLAQTDFVY